MAEVWKEWEGQVVNREFPLRRYLGGSDHSGVFLTEYAAPEPVNAAIKLVPADPTLTAATLWRWKMAATLSHPHLVRVFDCGQCQLGGDDFLFVVMEYADQNLSEILPRRPLIADEVGELLAPTLEALGFLHRENLVQGQLRPSNILVVNDQLKLASDTVHPAGEFAQGVGRTTVYDAPEARSGRISPAADIWALGVTMVEALTQHAPAGPAERYESVSLPVGVSQSLADTIRRCLSIDPDKRPTVARLQDPTGQDLPEHAPSEPAPVARASAAQAPPGLTASAPTASARVVSVPTPGRAAPTRDPPAQTAALEAAAARIPPVLSQQVPASRPQTASVPTTAAASSPPRAAHTQVSSSQTPAAQDPEIRAPSSKAQSTAAPRAPVAPADTPPFGAPPPNRDDSWDVLSRPPSPPKRWPLVPMAAVLLVGIAALWGGFRFFRARPTALRPAATVSQTPAQQDTATPGTSEVNQPPRMPVPPEVAVAPPPAKSGDSIRGRSSNSSHPPGRSRQPAGNTSSPVLHEEIPNVPRSARNTIHGHLKVAVRVTVDAAGNVVNQTLENPGPSKYFARLASEAARKWKFAAADTQQSRQWLLRFEFTRDGTTGQATAPRS